MSGLYYFPTSTGLFHIGRTIIAGCCTECGVVLKRGQDWVRQAPRHLLCRKCVETINALPYIHGLRA